MRSGSSSPGRRYLEVCPPFRASQPRSYVKSPAVDSGIAGEVRRQQAGSQRIRALDFTRRRVRVLVDQPPYSVAVGASL